MRILQTEMQTEIIIDGDPWELNPGLKTFLIIKVSFVPEKVYLKLLFIIKSQKRT